MDSMKYVSADHMEGIARSSVTWKLLLVKDEKSTEIESKGLETFIAIWI